MLNASSPTNPVNGTDNSSSSNNPNVIKRAFSRAAAFMKPFVKNPFTRAPATNLQDPEEDVHDLEGAQDTHGHPPSGIQPANQGTHGTAAGNRSAANRSSLHNLQDIGLKIVKFWVLPTSMVIAPSAISTAVNLYQVFKTNPSVAGSTKTFMLKPYLVSAMVNVAFGAVLFVLSTTKGNFWGKGFFLKVIITLTSASAVLEIVMLSAVGWQFVSLV